MKNLIEKRSIVFIATVMSFVFLSVSNITPMQIYHVKAEETPGQNAEKRIEFIDVARGSEEGNSDYHWAKDFIYKLADKELINGYPLGDQEEGIFEFKPDQLITRAEYLKMLINAFDILEAGATCPEFVDVEPGSWYEEFVATAKNKEITSGKDESHFAPGEYMSREQMMTLTARTLKAVKGKEYPAAGEISELLKDFTDQDDISPFTNFKESVALNVKLEIVGGYGQDDGSFKIFPKAEIKRGEVAKILAGAMDIQEGDAQPASTKVPAENTEPTSAAKMEPGDFSTDDFDGSLNADNQVTIKKYKGSESTVIIPDVLEGGTVMGIGDNAFKNNINIKIVMIPNSPISIGTSAFEGCKNLEDVSIAKKENNAKVLAANIKRSAPVYANSNDQGHQNDQDEEVKWGKSAFDGCENLESVDIPENVTNLEDNIFNGCKKLKFLYIPSSLKMIGSYAFYDCGSLTSVNIPDGVKTIGNNAFMACENLTNVVISDSVTLLGDAAFSLCVNLESVTIGNGITIIGHNMFDGCISLKAMEIPDSVRTLSDTFMKGCTGLESIVIGHGVTAIKKIMFEDCSKSLKHITVGNGVSSLEDNIFYNFEKIESIIVGHGVTSIGYAAFGGCGNLMEMYFEGNAPTANGSFDVNICCMLYYREGSTGWTNLWNGIRTIMIGGNEDIYMDDNFMYIINETEASIFRYIGSDDNIAIPDVVSNKPLTFIEDNAFRFCLSKSITIPDSVTTIGNGAFQFCSKLEEIYFEGNAPEVGEGIFDGIYTNLRIYYKEGTIGWDAEFWKVWAPPVIYPKAEVLPDDYDVYFSNPKDGCLYKMKQYDISKGVYAPDYDSSGISVIWDQVIGHQYMENEAASNVDASIVTINIGNEKDGVVRVAAVSVVGSWSIEQSLNYQVQITTDGVYWDYVVPKEANDGTGISAHYYNDLKFGNGLSKVDPAAEVWQSELNLAAHQPIVLDEPIDGVMGIRIIVFGNTSDDGYIWNSLTEVAVFETFELLP